MNTLAAVVLGAEATSQGAAAGNIQIAAVAYVIDECGLALGCAAHDDSIGHAGYIFESNQESLLKMLAGSENPYLGPVLVGLI